MDVIRGIENIPAKYDCAVVTIGNFDGIHLAHQGLLNKVVEEARKRSPAIVLSFEPHPQMVLHPERRPFYLITSLEEKLSLLAGLGIDTFILIAFTPEFAKTTAEAFVRGVLWERLHLEKIIIGHDTPSGAARAATRTS